MKVVVKACEELLRKPCKIGSTFVAEPFFMTKSVYEMRSGVSANSQT